MVEVLSPAVVNEVAARVIRDMEADDRFAALDDLGKSAVLRAAAECYAQTGTYKATFAMILNSGKR